MEVEAAFNRSLVAHELFIRPTQAIWLTYLLVALDDDKCHYSYSFKSNNYGLKRCWHVMDNSLELTAHTAALPVSSFPLSIMWEREKDTSTTTFVWMVKMMFGQRSKDGQPPDLYIQLSSTVGS